VERNGAYSLILVTTGIDRTTVKSSLSSHENLRIPDLAIFGRPFDAPNRVVKLTPRPNATTTSKVSPSRRHGPGTGEDSVHAVSIRLVSTHLSEADSLSPLPRGDRTVQLFTNARSGWLAIPIQRAIPAANSSTKIVDNFPRFETEYSGFGYSECFDRDQLCLLLLCWRRSLLTTGRA
jgi:hypothetical protein